MTEVEATKEFLAALRKWCRDPEAVGQARLRFRKRWRGTWWRRR